MDRLPDSPIAGYEDLNAWMDGFWSDFSQSCKNRPDSNASQRSKFVREGSCATLTACWITRKKTKISLSWLNYGDSPLLIFDRTPKSGLNLLFSAPFNLADMGRDPHLLNWKDLPDAGQLRAGSLDLPERCTVVLASDGIGQFLWLRHLRHTGAVAPGISAPSPRLDDAFRAHAAQPPTDFVRELDAVRANLDDEAAFAHMLAAIHAQGLMANDDATLILIDVDVEWPHIEPPPAAADATPPDDTPQPTDRTAP
ncbi:MAG: hypothetical protein HQL36_12270 [Alphaproteobacteria bacterium]|nr:hypothetical protein [Alphaproteobacteria bacterium]MBF0249176.1 hypothetical protein [Alphaproteobacteria bacterium]